MRRIGIGVAVALPIVVFGVALVNDAAVSTDPMRAIGFPATPIPGLEVTLAQARNRASEPLLTIADAQVTDPCTGISVNVSITNVWASPQETPTAAAQFGMNYSEGIWVSMARADAHDDAIAKADDLPPVADAFAKSDFPAGLTDGTVRGHSAWMRELGEFSCEETTAKMVGDGELLDVDPKRPLEQHGGLMFDPRVLASVTWKENGFVIEIVGPFDSKTLASLAEEMKP